MPVSVIRLNIEKGRKVMQWILSHDIPVNAFDYDRERKDGVAVLEVSTFTTIYYFISRNRVEEIRVVRW